MKKEANPTFLSATAGAARYEFRMQIRRRAVWVTMFLFVLLSLTETMPPWDMTDSFSVSAVILSWSQDVQLFMPIALGCLLADRLPRDRRTRAIELLETTPTSSGCRLIGKYLGSTLATLVPLSLVYFAGIAFVVADRGAPEVVPLSLAAFVAVNLPGLLFVAAFSVSCPAVLWVPLYQFLFVGYWFWGNLLNPYGAILTLSGTMLTPVGRYAGVGFFGVYDEWIGEVAAWESAASIALLLGLGALALLCAHRYLIWQRARR